MRKTLTVLAVLLFVVAVALIAGYTPLKTDTACTDSAEVLVTVDGYSPTEVCITPGGTITWTNVDARGMWPASNDHPTHTGYSEKTEEDCLGSAFDACRVFRSGETWSFTFNEVGVWPYHDHIYPSRGGIVKVTEETDTALQSIFASLPSFEKQQEPRHNLSTEEFNVMSFAKQRNTIKQMAQKSPEEAWNFLKKVSTQDGQVVINRHEFAHVVANTGYTKHGLEGIKMCDETFAYGCYHGYTEEFLAEQGPEKIPAAEERCGKLFDSETMAYSSCIHGLGHGVLTYTNLNLNNALEICDSLQETNRHYCYDGVFMEYAFVNRDAMVDKDTPWTFCNSLSSNYHAACARYMPQTFTAVLSADSRQIAKLCGSAPTTTLSEFCADSFGFHLASQYRNDGKSIAGLCREAGAALFSRCISAAAIELRFQNYSNTEETSEYLCSSLTEPSKGECLSRLSNI